MLARAAADPDEDWSEHLHVPGDEYFSAQGNSLMFRELAKQLLP